MSATYAAVYSVVLPEAAQVVDPFHVDRSGQPEPRHRAAARPGRAGSVHQGRRDDPLYRARRVLLMGEEKLDDDATERLWSLLELGDPNGEVAIAYRVN